MQVVSQNFMTEVSQSHKAIIVAEIWSGPTKVATIYPIDGSVSVDARRSIRRSCSFTLVDETGALNPRNLASPISPYSTNEIKLFRGVRYADGTSEVVPLGVFRISNVSISRGDSGVVLGISGEDRARVIQRKNWSNPYPITSGTNVATAIQNIVLNRYAGVSTNVNSTVYTTPTAVLGVGNESDPFNDIIAIAEAVGHEAFFAADGTFRTSPIPRLNAANPVATISDTSSSSVLLSLEDSMGTDEIYNGVIASAENSNLATPLEARVWDDDSNSPTRRTGPLGERAYRWASSWVRTQTQLNDVAAAIFENVRGESVSFTMVPNPALDVRDVIRITSADTSLNSVAVIDTIEIPLTPEGQMSVTARMRGY
jgi:hypothetical protein